MAKKGQNMHYSTFALKLLKVKLQPAPIQALKSADTNQNLPKNREHGKALFPRVCHTLERLAFQNSIEKFFVQEAKNRATNICTSVQSYHSCTQKSSVIAHFNIFKELFLYFSESIKQRLLSYAIKSPLSKLTIQYDSPQD